MSDTLTQTLAACAAVILALSSIGTIITVPTIAAHNTASAILATELA